MSNIAGLSVRPRSSARTGSRPDAWPIGSWILRPTDRADAGRITLNAQRRSLFRVMYDVRLVRVEAPRALLYALVILFAGPEDGRNF